MIDVMRLSEVSRGRKARVVAYTGCTAALLLIRCTGWNTTLTAQLRWELHSLRLHDVGFKHRDNFTFTLAVEKTSSQ
jgi:hypothetical protein